MGVDWCAGEGGSVGCCAVTGLELTPGSSIEGMDTSGIDVVGGESPLGSSGLISFDGMVGGFSAVGFSIFPSSSADKSLKGSSDGLDSESEFVA